MIRSGLGRDKATSKGEVAVLVDSGLAGENSRLSASCQCGLHLYIQTT
jgi:hypothetical protein